MASLRKILTSEWFFVIFISLLGMSLSLYPMIYELFRRHEIFPDRQFVLVYNFAPDFNAYLSKIIQGIQGRWLVVEYFTSELHQGALLQIFYLMVGKIGGLFSANSEFSYHVARILFGLGWILAGWYFIKYSFASKLYRKIALLFFVFGGNFPHIVPDQSGYGFPFLGIKWDQTMVGWSNLDPVRRMTFIPHWNAGHMMTVVSLMLFIKATKNLKLNTEKLLSIPVLNFKYLVLSIIFGIAAGLILPPTLIIVYAILGFFIGFKFTIWVFTRVSSSKFSAGSKSLASFTLKNPPGFFSARDATPRKFDDLDSRFNNLTMKQFNNFFVAFLLYFFFTFPTLIYNLWITSFYPWKALVETDLFVNKIVFPYFSYLVALGPLGFLGLFGAVLVLLLKKEKFYWSSFWVLGMFILIILFDKVLNWHDQTRFLEVGPELSLAILSVVALSQILGFLGVLGKLKKTILILTTIIMMLLAGFLFSISIRAQVDFIDHKILGSYPPLSLGNYVVYPYKTIMEGVDFIKNNAVNNDMTLSGPVTGNHIGAYAGRFVYVGHGSQTVHYYNEKLPFAKEYYAGLMSDNDVKNFFIKNRIKYIFYGPEEKEFGEFPMRDGNLKELFRNMDVIIYQVQF